MSSPLFEFTFQLTKPNMDIITCTAYGKTYSEACRKILAIELPIIADSQDDLDNLIENVLQVTEDEEETETP